MDDANEVELDELYDVSIEFRHGTGHGISAFTTALRLRASLEEARAKNNQAGDDEEMYAELRAELEEKGKQVAIRLEFVSKALELFSAQVLGQERSHVWITKPLVDRWDKILQHKESHDVVIETADEPCGAHAVVLRQASSVLSASLDWQDGPIVINFKDSCSSAVKLFLELIYIGGTSVGVNADVALTTLELAHRWQVVHVMAMVQNLLEDLLTEETVGAVADAAQRMQLADLQQVCRLFAYRSSTIRTRAREGSLPPELKRLFSFSLCDDGPSPKKRRML